LRAHHVKRLSIGALGCCYSVRDAIGATARNLERTNRTEIRSLMCADGLTRASVFSPDLRRSGWTSVPD